MTRTSIVARSRTLVSAARAARERRGPPSPHPMAPFASRDFRRFWFAGTLSFTGFAIQTLSRGWLMNEMTGSPFLVSLVTATMMLPMLFLSLPGGVLADRLDQARMVVLGEALVLASFAALAVLVVTHAVQPWSLLTLSTVSG
ncbi:MAG: MFS transporter, partial [Gemmatimonadetes bacterium]|nr:MFS transporter [Gemmatimonadota bacterium]